MQLSLISLALTKVYGGAAAFSPSSLFASGEQGAWYDPSDLSTMFQDSAGTTPVTADGQPIGLILDKSKGLLLGTTIFSEDGASASDWVYPGINGGSVTAVSGEIKLTCGNPLSALTDRLCYSTITGLSIGDTYKATVTFRKITESVGARISVVAAYTTGDANGVYVDNTATVSSEKTLYFVASDTTMYFRLIAINGNSSATVGLSSATIRKIAGNHASQATTASRPLYKTDGTYHWLQFDGVDDSLSTAEIDFTGTDKITNWYGISKSTDSGNGMAVEYSPGNSPGSFYFLAPAAGANYQFALTGSVSTATVGATITTYTAPIKNVLAVSYDTAQPARETEILVKVNGALVTPSSWVGAASCGSGPFGGYTLFIGRRGGTTLPFTGNIYSLIVRGALSTAQQITDAETWVNQRTGAY